MKAIILSLAILFACAASASAQYTIWPSTATPAVSDVGADSPVELGVRFKADSNGYITGIRFYKSAANTGTHIGNLWSNSGTLLATATFANETASGWQQVNFATPVAITAGTVYVASYHSTIGHYSVTNSNFATAGVDNPPLHALANSTSTADGPYCYGSSSCFPTATYQASNYWVDVIFTPSSGTAGNPVSVSTTALPNGTVSVAYTQALSATGGTSPYSWSLASGSLPSGLSLASSGTISGTPTTAANSSFSVQVRDASGATASTSLGINVVNAALPTVAITSPANGSSVSGTVNIAGTASDGMSISSVKVAVDGGGYSNASGTTSWSFPVNSTSLSSGTHTFVAQVSDSGGRTATSSLLSLNVNNSSLAGNCTIYASPSGGGSGASSSSPASFAAAASATQPGSVVCLMGGTYNLGSTFVPPVSGTSSSWITYKSYGNGAVN
ncbi:MAG TPA: DUF4082 domain-containing protein, partial [Candidatus Acidoferrum sp.]|nr:DUF4082 domain-containing protein [Candidatus Acidoferrum sp.]